MRLNYFAVSEFQEVFMTFLKGRFMMLLCVHLKQPFYLIYQISFHPHVILTPSV